MGPVFVHGTHLVDNVLERTIRDAVVRTGSVSAEPSDWIKDAGIDEVTCIQCFLPISDEWLEWRTA